MENVMSRACSTCGGEKVLYPIERISGSADAGQVRCINKSGTWRADKN